MERRGQPPRKIPDVNQGQTPPRGRLELLDKEQILSTQTLVQPSRLFNSFFILHYFFVSPYCLSAFLSVCNALLWYFCSNSGATIVQFGRLLLHRPLFYCSNKAVDLYDYVHSHLYCLILFICTLINIVSDLY